MDVLIWVYWWFNAETEEKGKRCRDRQFHRPPRENLSNFEVWQQKMREVGAVSSVEEHWECQYICGNWEKMQAEAQARPARSHNAQPLTFDQVFGLAQQSLRWSTFETCEYMVTTSSFSILEGCYRRPGGSLDLSFVFCCLLR